MKPPGSVVTLGYDNDDEVEAGDVIETSTGRRYLVHEARRVRRRPGVAVRWRFRWRLQCVVLDPDEAHPEGARVHELVWYDRGRRQ